jgi:hypothetical protein
LCGFSRVQGSRYRNVEVRRQSLSERPEPAQSRSRGRRRP